MELNLEEQKKAHTEMVENCFRWLDKKSPLDSLEKEYIKRILMTSVNDFIKHNRELEFSLEEQSFLLSCVLEEEAINKRKWEDRFFFKGEENPAAPFYENLINKIKQL